MTLSAGGGASPLPAGRERLAGRELCNQLPTASLVCPAHGNVGTVVTLDASGSNDDDGSIVSYVFLFDDGTTISGAAAAVQHTYAAPGAYEASVTVEDDAGASAQQSCSLTIEAVDPCVGLTCLVPPAAICLSGATRRVFVGPGVCIGDGCVFSYTDETCAGACVAGECAAAICGGTSCLTPPAPLCADARILRSFAPVGSCASGSCVYAELDGFCTDGCAGGACAPGSWLLTSMSGTTNRGAPNVRLDSHGNPHLGYISGRDVVVTSLLPTGWTTTIVDASVTDDQNDLAMEIDTANRIHLFYSEPSNGNVRYAVGPPGGPFSVEFVESSATATGLDMVLDPNGAPHAILHDRTDDAIKLVRRDATAGWVVTHQLAAVADSVTASLVLDGNNEPIIAYDLNACCPNSSLETSVGLPTSGTWTTLPLPVGGFVSAMVLDPGTGELFVLTRNGGSVYVSHGVPPAPFTSYGAGYCGAGGGPTGDLALDGQGTVHVVFRELNYPDYYLGHSWRTAGGTASGFEEVVGGSYAAMMSCTLDASSRLHIVATRSNNLVYVRPAD